MDTLSYERNALGRWAGLVLQDTYRLGSRIGRGSMGEVYEAGHARLPGRFAIKILHPELAANQEAFARFCREAEIMSALRHPHIVQIFDFNTTPDGLPYFVMEYLEGVDLQARLADARPLPLTAVIRIVESVASALGTAHAHGIVHRDLKPSNIFLMQVEGQEDDFVKVLDFGISKMRAATTRLSSGGEVFGTPQFMAPEQATGQLELIDARTDQFALAAIAYEMLTGQDAFRGEDPSALLYQVVHEEPAPLSQYLGWDTTRLQAVLDRALAKHPAHRFPSIVEFARALEAAADGVLCRPVAAQAPMSMSMSVSTPTPIPAPMPTPGPVLRPIHLVATPSPAPPELPPLIDDEPPPRRLTSVPAAVEVRRHEPAIRQEPAVRNEPVIDEWDLPSNVDRVPVSGARAVALGMLAMALAGLLLAKGWYREVPGDLAFVRANGGALFKRPIPLAQPKAPQDVPQVAVTTTPAAAPASADSAGAGEEAAEQEPPRETTPPRDRTDEAVTAEERPAHHRTHHAPTATAEAPPQPPAERVRRDVNPFLTAPTAADTLPQSAGAAPPAPAPLPSPGGFTIAPPTIEPAPRDLAPIAPAPQEQTQAQTTQARPEPAPRPAAATPPPADEPLPPSTP